LKGNHASHNFNELKESEEMMLKKINTKLSPLLEKQEILKKEIILTEKKLVELKKEYEELGKLIEIPKGVNLTDLWKFLGISNHEFFKQNSLKVDSGVFQFLGNLNSDQWKNPSEKGLVELKCSESNSTGTLSSIVDEFVKNSSFYVSSCKIDDFIEISIEKSGYLLNPTSYSIKNRDLEYPCAFRNWDLIGSSNNKDWKVIKSHRNDTSLNDEVSQSFTWNLSEDQFYHTFRIVLKGESSYGNKNHHMMISKVEFNGNLQNKF
jgi:hypothetical protein